MCIVNYTLAFLKWIINVAGLAREKVVSARKKFGSPAFPKKGMYTNLVSQLAIMVFRGMKWDMIVGEVMPKVGGAVEYFAGITCFEGLDKL